MDWQEKGILGGSRFRKAELSEDGGVRSCTITARANGVIVEFSEGLDEARLALLKEAAGLCLSDASLEGCVIGVPLATVIEEDEVAEGVDEVVERSKARKKKAAE